MNAPMLAPDSEPDLERQIHAISGGLPRADRAGSSHGAKGVHRNTAKSASAASLTEAFAEFIAASSRLECSYRDLQAEVSGLTQELAERNAALTTSLAENESMRGSMQQIVDSMPCGVLVVDARGTVLTINPEGRRLLGSARTAAIGSLDEAAPGCQLDLRRFYGGMAGGETVEDTEQEFCVPGPEGKRWIELRNRRLAGAQGKDADGDDRGGGRTVLILREITAQKRMEQEREATLRAMTLAEISAVLAHEIRNPLASLELFAGLIAEDGVTRPEWSGHLRAGIRSLSGTVNNVLSFHGAGQMDLGPVDLPAAIAMAVEFVRPIAEQAGVGLRWLGTAEACDDGSAPAEDARLRVLGNEGALQQVVLNLASNAIRHTPAGGGIRVSVHADSAAGGRRATVRIQDTGCGIPPGMAMKVFDAGFSAGGDTPGLGLAVCRTIMEKHGGSIRIANGTPGQAPNGTPSGTTFELEFPLL